MEYDVLAYDDLPDGGMRAVQVAGRTVLLTRLKGIYYATGNDCPHAGGPLDEGVLDGENVICPWHKAAFCVTSGLCTAPPALDDIPRFETRSQAGRVFMNLGNEPDALDSAMPTPSQDQRCFALIGAGAAGESAAQALRRAGFSGRIVLVSREDELPYDRTLLSKYALSGQEGGEKTPLQDSGFYQRHRIERRFGTVTRIEPHARTILFDDGASLAYDEALIATGGAPRPLAVEGATLGGVFVLRSAQDARDIAAAAEDARSVVVAGASFIAMEAAASLRERGLAVTVVAPQKTPFEHTLGAQIGAVFRQVHEREGVVFRLDDEIVALEGEGRVARVRLRSGAVLETDLVVAGLGVSPATDILPDIPKRDDRGVTVESRLRLADHLYAAGDIAAFPCRGDGPPIRVEHWRVAQQQGHIAALNMLGRNVAFDAVPYFWTIHFLKRLDYVGHAEKWDEIIVDGDLDKPQFLAFYLQAGKVAAVAGWDRDRQMAAAIGLLTRRRDWPLAELRAALAAID